jgi:3-deoxy-D-manno-octulosonic-acid transferase
MIIIYNIALHILYFFSFILKPFFQKFNEREKNVNSSLQSLNKLDHTRKKTWFHAASVGEFEQAKPIIETLKSKFPDLQIICSFFSPSAYRTQAKYEYADATFYLPLDLPTNSKFVINKIKPNAVVFVRYELWANYLFLLKNYNVPTFLVNATAPNQNFFNKTFFMKKFYKFVFSLFHTIFVVNSDHSHYFQQLNVKFDVQVLPDTRFDRIVQKVETAKSKPIISHSSFSDKFIFVAGSIWEKDFEIIANALIKYNSNNSNKITSILVPHEPHETFLQTIETVFPNSIRLSKLLSEPQTIQSGGVVLVDSIGKLLMLYSNAYFAYVGGAFGVGVHSLTEPAGYGIPIACGPNCFNSPDAKPMLDCNALSIIRNSDEFHRLITELTNNQTLHKIRSEASRNYVYSKVGSSDKFVEFLSQFLQ